MIAAQAAARRRTVIAVALAVLGLLASVSVMGRDVQVQPTYATSQ